MRVRRLYALVLTLTAGWQAICAGQETGAKPAEGPVSQAKLSAQLKINKEALLNMGSDEQMRLDAATLMLYSEEQTARNVLLEILTQSQNNAARTAVCKVLAVSGTFSQPLKGKDTFARPLLDVLSKESDSVLVQAVCEALTIFEYEQVGTVLEQTATDKLLKADARINAISALKLQPNKKAIFKLMDLLENEDQQIAAASKEALTSLGIPVGDDAKSRRQIRNELRQKNREQFLRDWQIRRAQDEKLRKLRKDVEFWQKKCLAALGQFYVQIGDDAGRKSRFLVEQLKDPAAAVRLWALEMVSQWWQGTSPKSNLLAEVGPTLVELISDDNRQVKLQVAKLLSLMGQLNSSGKLLERIKVEDDEEVKMEMFVALGAACSYAFLPDSSIKPAPEVRNQTLSLAVEYLSSDEPKKAQQGAAVIRKLLEQDGLEPGEVNKYLNRLVKRYTQEENSADGKLRGELLNEMADLCAQSGYKAQAASLFGDSFAKALQDKTQLVREAAVDGLINVDKAEALKILRDGFVDDSSAEIRKTVINLTSQVGGQKDLAWLAEKVGKSAESDSAWKAMYEIFRRAEGGVLSDWGERLDAKHSQGVVTNEQMIAFLEMGERRPGGPNAVETQRGIRRKLVELYSRMGKFNQAAEYLGKMRNDAGTDEEREAIVDKLLDLYLKWPKLDQARDLVEHRLLAGDLDPNSFTVRSIEGCFRKPSGAVEPNSILEELAKIAVPDRPKWSSRMQFWNERFGRLKSSGTNTTTETQ